MSLAAYPPKTGHLEDILFTNLKNMLRIFFGFFLDLELAQICHKIP